MKYYDACDRNSVLLYAKLLEDKRLCDLYPSDSIEGLFPGGKGDFGNIVEVLHFGLSNNSRAEADLPCAGVELKTSPIAPYKSKKGFRSKERLVLGLITYPKFKNPIEQALETSSFWNKNKLILIMFYVWVKDQPHMENLFKIIRYFEFPVKDLRIIRDDWDKIVGKIKAGDAHKISGGDTLYLEACTKGGLWQNQPFSNEPAISRAFALKQRYLRFIIAEAIGTRIDSEPILKSINDLPATLTFEELIISRFRPYFGMTEAEIASKTGTTVSKAKHRRYLLSKAILGITSKHPIEEFEKADVQMKTVTLKLRGQPDQHMSFEQIDYKGILEETWEESYWYQTLTKRFFFVIYQKGSDRQLRLKDCFFWTMPTDDLVVARKFWEHTRNKVIEEDFHNFWRISDGRICHVRPKGKNRQGEDLAETLTGRLVEKNCYWLNKKYIRLLIDQFGNE